MKIEKKLQLTCFGASCCRNETELVLSASLKTISLNEICGRTTVVTDVDGVSSDRLPDITAALWQ